MANLLLDATNWTDGTNTPPSQYNDQTKTYEFLAGGSISLVAPAAQGDTLKFSTIINQGTFGSPPLHVDVWTGGTLTEYDFQVSDTASIGDIQLNAGDTVNIIAMNGSSYYYGDVLITPTPDAQPAPTPEIPKLKQLFRKYDDGSSFISNEKYRAVDGHQHIQNDPSTTWFIAHNKGSSSFSINVFIENKLVECDVNIIDDYSASIVFSQAVSGFANLLFLIDKSRTVVPPTPSVTPTPSPTPTPSVTPTPSPTVSTAYVNSILAKSPIAYWSLSSGMADDVSGNTLTLGANASLAPDSFGNTLQFAQSAATSNLGAFMATPFTLTNNYTLEAWVKITTYVTNQYSTIFGDTSSSSYGFQLQNNGTTTGNIYLYGTTDAIDSSYALGILDKYSHLVMTVDSSSNVNFYVNGTKVNSVISASVDTYHYGILGDDTFNTEALIGYIGDPAIYNRVLSDAEILENYNNGLSYRYA